MKTKYSLIAFIPALIVAVGLKVMSIFNSDSTGLLFGMNKSTVNYVVIGITLALFAVCVIINITDRKTAPVYAAKKNPAAGFLALLSGFAVLGSSFLTLLNTSSSETESYLMGIIAFIFSIPAAVALILMGRVHFSGKTKVSNASTFFVVPALWSCTELVSEFLAAQKASISASDMTPLFAYIFITLFLFSSSMVISRVKGRNPVKACFIYGLPAAAVSIAYGVGVICTATIENTGIQSFVSGIMFIILALYALSFIIEMFVGCLTKAEVEIIDSLPQEEDSYENSYISSGAYDDLVASDQDEDDAPKSYSDAVASEISDFVIGYDDYDYEPPVSRVSRGKRRAKTGVADGIVFDSKPEPVSDKNDNVQSAPTESEPESEPETKAETEQPKAEDEKPADESVPAAEADEKSEPIQTETVEIGTEPAAEQPEAPQKQPEDVLTEETAPARKPDQRRRPQHTQRGVVRTQQTQRRPQPARHPVQSQVTSAEESPANVAQPVKRQPQRRSAESVTAYGEQRRTAAPTNGSAVSSERMSDIDRLLKELEDKK